LKLIRVVLGHAAARAANAVPTLSSEPCFEGVRMTVLQLSMFREVCIRVRSYAMVSSIE
jgi:hypothetical protein